MWKSEEYIEELDQDCSFPNGIQNLLDDINEFVNIIICKTYLSFTLLLILIGPVSIAEFIVGIINIDNCPIQPMIPIWLVVTAVINIIFILLTSIDNICKKRNGSVVKITRLIIFLSFLFELIWIILGSFWVYLVTNNVFYNSNQKLYCDKSTYWFSFCIATSYALILVSLITLILCLRYCRRENTSFRPIIYNQL